MSTDFGPISILLAEHGRSIAAPVPAAINSSDWALRHRFLARKGVSKAKISALYQLFTILFNDLPWSDPEGEVAPRSTGTPLDELGDTPPYLAAETRETGLTSLPLEHGADTTVIGLNGDIPLAVARRQGHTSVGRLLESALQPVRWTHHALPGPFPI